jgi:hypothetical protein
MLSRGRINLSSFLSKAATIQADLDACREASLELHWRSPQPGAKAALLHHLRLMTPQSHGHKPLRWGAHYCNDRYRLDITTSTEGSLHGEFCGF